MATSLQANLKSAMNKAVFSKDADGASDVNNSPTETVVYNPSEGDARPIQAKVRRDAENYGNTVAPVFEVTVSNDASEGISSAEIDIGADTIDIALRLGEARTERTFKRIVRHNTAVMVLEIN